MKIGYDVSGLKIDQAIDEIIRRTVQGVSNACLLIEADAVERCPEGEHEGADTVSLAQSIASKITVDGAKAVGVVGSGLDYAVYVHEGTGIRSRTGMGRTHDLPWSYQDDRGEWHTTSGSEAQPFLEQAYDANQRKAKEVIREAIFKG